MWNCDLSHVLIISRVNTLQTATEFNPLALTHCVLHRNARSLISTQRLHSSVSLYCMMLNLSNSSLSRTVVIVTGLPEKKMSISHFNFSKNPEFQTSQEVSGELAQHQKEAEEKLKIDLSRHFLVTAIQNNDP